MSTPDPVAPESRPKKKKRGYTRTGLTALRAKVKVRGLHALDTRTAGAQAVLSVRNDLIRDKGGEQGITAQQRQLIELASRTRLFLDHVDGWLLSQPSLVLKKRRTVHPVLIQRQQLADALARYLDQLGLERVSPPITWKPWENESKNAQEPRSCEI